MSHSIYWTKTILTDDGVSKLDLSVFYVQHSKAIFLVTAVSLFSSLLKITSIYQFSFTFTVYEFYRADTEPT